MEGAEEAWRYIMDIINESQPSNAIPDNRQGPNENSNADPLNAVSSNHKPLNLTSHPPKYSPPLYCDPDLENVTRKKKAKMIFEHHLHLQAEYNRYARESIKAAPWGKPIKPRTRACGSLCNLEDVPGYQEKCQKRKHSPKKINNASVVADEIVMDIDNKEEKVTTEGSQNVPKRKSGRLRSKSVSSLCNLEDVPGYKEKCEKWKHSPHHDNGNDEPKKIHNASIVADEIVMDIDSKEEKVTMKGSQNVPKRKNGRLRSKSVSSLCNAEDVPGYQEKCKKRKHSPHHDNGNDEPMQIHNASVVADEIVMDIDSKEEKVTMEESQNVPKRKRGRPRSQFQ